MRRSNRKFFLFVTLFSAVSLLTAPALAAQTLSDWATSDKLEKKIISYPIGNEIRSVKAAGIHVRRVGLVSFYILDTGNFAYNAMADTYGGKTKEIARLSGEGANYFATLMAMESVDGMKKVFALHGMDLLTPTEFITDDHQLEALRTFKLKQGNAAGITKAVYGYLQKNPQTSAAAQGFAFIPAAAFIDAPTKTSMEELRQALGLDALLVVQNTTASSKKAVSHIGTEMYLFGPNPLPVPEIKIARMSYSEGATYAHALFAKGYKGSEIARMKKLTVTSVNLDGYTAIMKRTTNELLKRFEENYNKGT